MHFDMISRLFSKTETNSFTIKVKIIKKFDIKNFGFEKKIFRILVVDKNNSYIQVVFFNELVDKYFHIL